MPNITGSVSTKNPDKLFLSGASVTLVGGAVPLIVQSNSVGDFVFINVLPGSYLLTVNYQPFNFTEERKLLVEVDDLFVEFDINMTSRSITVDPYVKLKYFQYIFLAFLGLIFAVPLMYGLIRFDLNELQHADVARGVITYLLSATTVGMAATLMFAAIMTGGSDLDKRFDLGKQVLTSLIGVLGTVIGFYYGSTLNDEEQTKNKGHAISVEKVGFDPVEPDSGKLLNVTFQIKGGTPPYHYQVDCPSGFVESSGLKVSKTPSVKQVLKVLKVFNSQKPVQVLITASDETGNEFKNSYDIK